MNNLPIHHQLGAKSPAESRVRLFGMLRAGNTPGAAMTTLILLLALQPAAAQRNLTRPLVDWSDGLRVHRQVEQWVIDGVPSSSPEPIEVSGAAGVQVTLRWLGLTVGRGQWTRATDRTSDTLDLADAAHKATVAALGALQQRLEAQRTETVQTKMSDIAPRLTVDLQIARTPRHLVLNAAAPEHAVFDQFAPGYHGLILSSPDTTGDRHAYLFPADALSRNLNPRMQLISVLSALRLPAAQLVTIARPGGPELRRFEVIHLVRPTPRQPVVRLTRGNTVLPKSPLSIATLDAMGRRLSEHLVHRQRDDGTMAGTYQPTPDRYAPADASPREQAWALFAVARWLKLLNREKQMTQSLLDAQAAVRVGVDHVARELLIPLAEKDLPASAMTLMAITDCPSLSDRKALRSALSNQIVGAQDPNTGLFRESKDEDAAVLRASDQALPLVALARLYDQTRDETLLKPIARAYRVIAAKSAASGDVAIMPLVLDTAVILRRAGVKGIEDPASLSRAVTALLSRQVRAQPQLGPSDTIGGFDLAGDGTAPDWRTAYGLQFLAAVVRNVDRPTREKIGPSDVELILSCGLAARFLAQLMFDEPSCFYVRSRADTIGGVRKALWENALEPGPTAAALIAVTELQHTLVVWQKTLVAPDDAPRLPTE